MSDSVTSCTIWVTVAASGYQSRNREKTRRRELIRIVGRPTSSRIKNAEDLMEGGSEDARCGRSTRRTDELRRTTVSASVSGDAG